MPQKPNTPKAPTSPFLAWDSQVITAKDALADQPPRQYIIAKLLVLPSLNIIYGDSGVGKTMLLGDAAVCVAMGKAWLEPRPGEPGEPFKTIQSSVAWFDMDAGREDILENVGAILRAHNAPDSTPIFIWTFPDPPADVLNDDALAAIIQNVQKHHARLVVFDNFATFSSALNENSTEILEFVTRLKIVAIKTGSAVVVIHHEAKNRENALNGSRGSSAIRAALTTELNIARDGDAVRVTPTKTRKIKVPPFDALWTYEHKPNSETDLHTARFFGAESAPDDFTLGVRQLILDTLKKHGALNQSDLRKTIGNTKIKNRKISVGVLAAQLNFLVKMKQVTVMRAAHNSLVYEAI